jgi:Holliday junction resolvase-like predicted endonuclease
VTSGEIDLIARRGRVLAAIEVKARDSTAVADASISHHQRRRIARALAHFVATRPALAGLAPLRRDAGGAATAAAAHHRRLAGRVMSRPCHGVATKQPLRRRDITPQ